jgi:ribonuclease HI
MNRFSLFTDVSLNPRRRLGVGAYLVVPASLLNVPPPRIERSEIAERLVMRRFEDTSSTKLEVQTVLWALEEFGSGEKGAGPVKLRLYTDSQCVAGLPERRSRLEANGFLSKRSDLLLQNDSLYRKFYAFQDKLGFEVIKVEGHTRSCLQDSIQRVFSFVDKDVRKALQLWLNEIFS